MIEDSDAMDVLDEYGLMRGSKSVPQALPEFAIKVVVGGVEMLKIIWVCNDSFGLSPLYVLCPIFDKTSLIELRRISQ